MNNTQNLSINTNLLYLLTYFNQEYIKYKKAQNCSNITIRDYNDILERFYNYCIAESEKVTNLSIRDINNYFLNNYLLNLKTQGISPTSQKKYFTILKSYFWFIAESDTKEFGFLKLNITNLKIKVEQTEKLSFTLDEQDKIKNYITLLDNQKNYLAHRNALVVKLLLLTGIRIGELINIQWTDLDEYYNEEHGYIYTILINGKGNKQRYTYIQKSEIEVNLEIIANHKGKVGYLFTTAHGNILDKKNVYDTVKKMLQKSGVNKYGLHIFRHTFARNLVRKDHNLATIKELLGHSNISITAQFYAKSDENAKMNALFSKK